MAKYTPEQLCNYYLSLVLDDLKELLTKNIKSSYPYIGMINKLSTITYGFWHHPTGKLYTKWNYGKVFKWLTNNLDSSVSIREDTLTYKKSNIGELLRLTEKVAYPYKICISAWYLEKPHMHLEKYKKGSILYVNIMNLLRDTLKLVAVSVNWDKNNTSKIDDLLQKHIPDFMNKNTYKGG